MDSSLAKQHMHFLAAVAIWVRRMAMVKYLELGLVVLMAIIVFALVIAAGCVSTSQTSSQFDNHQPGAGARPGSGMIAGQRQWQNQTYSSMGGQRLWQNMTSEQLRQTQQWENMTPQQRQQERMRISIDACAEKTEGMPCEFSMRPGLQPSSGKCVAVNGTISCNIQPGTGGARTAQNTTLR